MHTLVLLSEPNYLKNKCKKKIKGILSSIGYKVCIFSINKK